MTDFRSTIDIATFTKPKAIQFSDNILTLGSCFAENIGLRLQNLCYNQALNPFGIIYNPSAMAQAIKRLQQQHFFSEKDIFLEKGVWQSFMHHSKFGAIAPQNTLNNINQAYEKGCLYFQKANYWILTLGTAWVYEFIETGQIVSNCHRQNPNNFKRFRLSIAQIVDNFSAILQTAIAANTDFQCIMTVSPIRHIKDTLHGNQLSKSTLLLAIEELQNLFPKNIFYFPAYEIMMDDLRDYRFYEEDMLHPSKVAVDYIWSIFKENYLNTADESLRKQILQIQNAANHRPFNIATKEHQNFLIQQIEKIKQLKRQYFQLDFSSIEGKFLSQLI